MSFIPDSEKIIYFDLPTRHGNWLTMDELHALRDAGIGTMMLSGTRWDKFEPEMGKYNWGYLEALLERPRLAGMKALLPLWEFQTSIYPREWYAQTSTGSLGSANGQPEHLLSIWNKDAQAHANEVLEMIKHGYTNDNVQVISTICRWGESVMPYDARYFDPGAIRSWQRFGGLEEKPNGNSKQGLEWLRQSYTAHIKAQQEILTNTRHKEAWFMFHMPKAGRPNNGVDWFDDYIRAVKEIDSSIVVNHITFTYFNDRYTQLPKQIAHLQAQGVVEWVGSQYCEGLRDGNWIKAQKAGIRGLICAPCHPLTNHKGLSDWMLEEIKKVTK